MTGDFLSQKLEQILADPALAALADPPADTEKTAKDQASADPAVSSSSASAAAPAAASVIPSFLSDPSLLQKLPQLLTLLKPLMQSSEKSEKGEKSTEEEKDNAIPTASGRIPPPPQKPRDRRIALLLALKPYLSSPRRESIDTLVTLCKWNDLLSGLL